MENGKNAPGKASQRFGISTSKSVKTNMNVLYQEKLIAQKKREIEAKMEWQARQNLLACQQASQASDDDSGNGESAVSNKFANDGSFLQQFLKLQKEKMGSGTSCSSAESPAASPPAVNATKKLPLTGKHPNLNITSILNQVKNYTHSKQTPITNRLSIFQFPDEDEEEDYEQWLEIKKMDPTTSNTGSKQKRRSYEAGFKLKVVARAEESNNSIASREFCVDEKQVREWRKMKADLEKIPKAKKARRGLTTSYGALETELHKWVMECRQNGYCVTRMGIRLRALQMAKDDKLTAPGIENFAASAGWCSRFMNRFDLCLRQRTKIAQKLQ